MAGPESKKVAVVGLREIMKKQETGESIVCRVRGEMATFYSVCRRRLGDEIQVSCYLAAERKANALLSSQGPKHTNCEYKWIYANHSESGDVLV
jgi:hypothetical protein